MSWRSGEIRLCIVSIDSWFGETYIECSAMNPPSDESDGPYAEMLPAAEFHQSREKASRFAVLGMLSLGEKLSGYDIRKVISESTANFWSESYGNIYPVLKRLLAEGA